MTLTDIVKKLPTSWSEVTLEQYVQLSHVLITEPDAENPFVGTDNTVKVIAVLTGLSVEELEERPYVDIAYLAERMSFLQTLPEARKNLPFKLRKLEDIPYDQFVSYMNHLAQPTVDIRPMVKLMAIDLKDEDVDSMKVDEAIGFFLPLKKHLKKYAASMIWSSRRKLMKQMFQNLKMALPPFKGRTTK